MVTITSKMHRKVRNSLFMMGGLYFFLGIVSIVFDGSPSWSSWLYVILGLTMLGLVLYKMKKGKFYSHISWDDQELILHYIEGKPLHFALSDIKTIRITDKSLTINAGMGNGEMIDLTEFEEKDKTLLKQTFEEKEGVFSA